MRLEMPKPIAAYFAADKAKSETILQSFTEDAIVKDEGQTYNGRSGIKKWRAHVSTKYQYTTEPLKCEEKDGKIIVTCRLTGDFPGSPVNLRFCFGLEGNKITFLEIIP